MMANRSDRGRGQPAVMSRASSPQSRMGPRPRKPSGPAVHDRANRPDTRLHPTNAPKPSQIPCNAGAIHTGHSRPHMSKPRPPHDQLRGVKGLLEHGAVDGMDRNPASYTRRLPAGEIARVLAKACGHRARSRVPLQHRRPPARTEPTTGAYGNSRSLRLNGSGTSRNRRP